jgi:hypothetical protein
MIKKTKEEVKEVACEPIQHKEIAIQFNAETLISQAIDQKVPVETMEKLLAMRRELKAEWSKEQFDKAMANFQGECPVIKKRKAGGKTNSGVIAYYYAPLEDIVEQTKELIRKNGFSYMIQTQTTPEGVEVVCTIKHQAGHSENSKISMPLGNKTGVMSAPQVVAAALTFAKRYAFSNAFGILTGDDDNDASSKDLPIEPSDKEKAANGFQTLRNAILKATVKELTEYQTKMSTSVKYTPEQKIEFADMVRIRLEELKPIKETK